MSVLTTGDLTIPTSIMDPWLGKIQYGSTVASLSNATPMKFGKGEAIIFDIGEAEYVGEGANKNSSTVTKTTQSTAPYKFHKTVRWTNEVMWADEDHQMGVIADVLSGIQPALSRALDYGIFHGINPIDGTPVTAMATSLSDTGNEVQVVTGDKPYANLDAADAIVLAEGYLPGDVALDPSFASQFSALRTDQGVKIYPDFRLTTAISDVEGHRASVSNTVGAVGVAATPTGIVGFVGNFGTIRWGVQRQIGLEVIEFGDPDGEGDLKRNNQVAFRAEVVYGWGIASTDAVAKILAISE